MASAYSYIETRVQNDSARHDEYLLDYQSITLLSLKRIGIVQLMIYNIWDGHNKMQVNSRCMHYKNSSTG